MTRTAIHDLPGRLERLGFVRDAATGWYDRGSVRVVIAVGERVAVYRFTDDITRVLIWEASFTHAPAQVVVATIRGALSALTGAAAPGPPRG